mmetsp:Transcript_3237/g.8191  ORF Transcript_3237/g.8191 Transcript_3237/m.8191 type:complete len:456 (+) Transcript_3237:178-1545(+)
MLLAGSVPRGLPALLAAAPLAWQVWNVRVPAREATHAAGERGAGLTLLRNFIHESLYHLKYGYFANRDVPVGRLTAPMAFNSLLGQDGYNYTLSRAYTRLQVAWLTPSEIFRPHYGNALAQCMLTHHLDHAPPGPRAPFVVYELGAGTGTVARNVLDYTREHEPAVYQDMHYITVEISESLAAAQHQQVCEEGGHHERFAVQRRDAADAAGWELDDGPCYVLALEVMDNMAHDRVVRRDGEWYETHVRHYKGCASGDMEEVLLPLQDNLIQRCMSAFDISESSQGAERGGGWLARWLSPSASAAETLFLPTRTLELFETLHRVRPNHRLLAADFSELPDVQIAGRNAPLVSNTQGGSTIDHATYLVPKGSADIFFPTDFEALSRLYTMAAASSDGSAPASSGAVASEYHNVADFMYTYADWKATSTMSGYNPLLEDFTNTMIFMGNMDGANVKQR